MGLHRRGKYEKKPRKFFTREDLRSFLIGVLLIVVDKFADLLIRLLTE